MLACIERSRDDVGGKHKVCGMEKLNEKVRFQNYPPKTSSKIC
jgi:hypothetical protein